MVVYRVLCIEDSNEKFMDIFRFLRNQNISHIDWVINAEKALKLVENSTKAGTNYDLIISDMHFDYFGEDDRNAGEKTMNLLRSKNYLIPFVFCSSQNWKIEGSIGNIFLIHEETGKVRLYNCFMQSRTCSIKRLIAIYCRRQNVEGFLLNEAVR